MNNKNWVRLFFVFFTGLVRFCMVRAIFYENARTTPSLPKIKAVHFIFSIPDPRAMPALACSHLSFVTESAGACHRRMCSESLTALNRILMSANTFTSPMSGVTVSTMFNFFRGKTSRITQFSRLRRRSREAPSPVGGDVCEYQVRHPQSSEAQ